MDWQPNDLIRAYREATENCYKSSMRSGASYREAEMPLDNVFTKAESLIDRMLRRMLKGKIILHDERIFSAFEPCAHWIVESKVQVD